MTDSDFSWICHIRKFKSKCYWWSFDHGLVKCQGKGFPYSIPSIGSGADPGVQAVSPQVTISHPPGGRLPLLSPGLQLPPQLQSITAILAGTKLDTAWWQRHIGVNNLPKVVTQHCLEQDLNPQPTDHKPMCITHCNTMPPWTGEELLRFRKWSSTHSGYFVVFTDNPIVC